MSERRRDPAFFSPDDTSIDLFFFRPAGTNWRPTIQKGGISGKVFFYTVLEPFSQRRHGRDEQLGDWHCGRVFSLHVDDHKKTQPPKQQKTCLPAGGGRRNENLETTVFEVWVSSLLADWTDCCVPSAVTVLLSLRMC
jgi:hypothetical protein